MFSTFIFSWCILLSTGSAGSDLSLLVGVKQSVSSKQYYRKINQRSTTLLYQPTQTVKLKMSVRVVSKKQSEEVRNGPALILAWANAIKTGKKNLKIKGFCPVGGESADGQRLAAEVDRILREDVEVDRMLREEERKDTMKNAAPFVKKNNEQKPKKSVKPKGKATKSLQKGTQKKSGGASRKNGGALGKKLNGGAKTVQKNGAKRQKNGAKKQKNGTKKQNNGAKK